MILPLLHAPETLCHLVPELILLMILRHTQGAADGSWGSNAAADDGDNFSYNGDGGGIYAGIHPIALVQLTL